MAEVAARPAGGAIPVTSLYLLQRLTPPSVFLGLDPRIYAGLHRQRVWILGSRQRRTEYAVTSSHR
ncbi:hypothetical protein FHS25_002017 [Rhizobium laguerreae]|jgi:hypothetical protein|uniref:Uncharacterized protein n=1 Tax=Rhizobium laguerreae TaxID=1076926 RepID=A0AAX2QQQ3_9HYPH|nr:hypothetical protein [Rhizobium laguerreae]TCU27106.1 hypothetical protein EV131_103136 [Rhizobium laguerreae]